MLWLALLVLPVRVEAPKGPNDSTIGTIEEFKVPGPARICFNSGAVDLAPDEVSYLQYLGIHSASITVVGPEGTVSVAEGDIWATPKRPGIDVSSLGNARVKRFGRRYAIYGRADYSPDRDHLLFWVDGLKRGASLDLLRRITPAVSDKDKCQKTYMYGMFFDEEPK